MATPIPLNRCQLSLREVADVTGGRLFGDPELLLEGVAIDSRAVTVGSLFVAIRGETQDGHHYLTAALDGGAGACVVVPDSEGADDSPRVEVQDTTRALGDLAAYVRRRWGGKVVAITGSAGKTTTKELTAAALAATGSRVWKTQGNLNNQFGVPMTVFGLTDAHDVAVLELGTSARGEIARLAEIVQPDVAVVLLAAAAHTAGLGSVADVADEKASLWGALGPDGTAVVNADDALLMARVPAGVRCMTFGTGAGVDVQLLRADLTLQGTDVVTLVRGQTEQHVALKWLGEAAAIDGCAAMVTTLSLLGEGALSLAVRGLAEAKPSPGRMCLRAGLAGTQLLDDTYNANPRSTELALRTLKTLATASHGRSIAVLADMLDLGALSRGEHVRIGELAVRLGIDILVGCGREMTHATAQAARLSGGRLAPHPTRVAHVLEPRDAVPVIKGLWRAGDVVLVKGSHAMAMESIVAGLTPSPTPAGGA